MALADHSYTDEQGRRWYVAADGKKYPLHSPDTDQGDWLREAGEDAKKDRPDGNDEDP